MGYNKENIQFMPVYRSGPFAKLHNALEAAAYVSLRYIRNQLENQGTLCIPTDEDIHYSQEDIIGLQAHDKKNPLYLQQLHMRVLPILNFVTDSINDLEKQKGEPSHVIRSTTVVDVVQSHMTNRRSAITYFMAYAHGKERECHDSFSDKVIHALQEGSDVDIVAEFDDMDDFYDKVRKEIGGYYDTGMPNLKDKKSGKVLKEIVNIDEEESKSKLTIWQLPRDAINVNLSTCPNTIHETYLRVEKRTTRSGREQVVIDFCATGIGNKINRENHGDNLTTLFSIAVDPYNSLSDELKATDVRSNPDTVNTWDHAAHARITFDSGGITIPAETLGILQQKNELGKSFDNLAPLVKLEEMFRVLRKGIVNFDMVESPESSLGIGIGVADSSLTKIANTFKSSEFKNKLEAAWGNLSEERKEYVSVKLTGELLTMLFFAPRETLHMIETLGIRGYLPNLHHDKVNSDTWKNMKNSLPSREIVETQRQLRMLSFEEQIELILEEYYKHNTFHPYDAWQELVRLQTSPYTVIEKLFEIHGVFKPEPKRWRNLAPQTMYRIINAFKVVPDKSS